LHPLQQTRTRQMRRASRGSRPVVVVALEVDSPTQPRAARLTSATACPDLLFFRDPILDQVLVDGLYWNTSSLLAYSDEPPVTTTCWFK